MNDSINFRGEVRENLRTKEQLIDITFEVYDVQTYPESKKLIESLKAIGLQEGDKKDFSVIQDYGYGRPENRGNPSGRVVMKYSPETLEKLEKALDNLEKEYGKPVAIFENDRFLVGGSRATAEQEKNQQQRNNSQQLNSSIPPYVPSSSPPEKAPSEVEKLIIEAAGGDKKLTKEELDTLLKSEDFRKAANVSQVTIYDALNDRSDSITIGSLGLGTTIPLTQMGLTFDKSNPIAPIDTPTTIPLKSSLQK